MLTQPSSACTLIMLPGYCRLNMECTVLPPACNLRIRGGHSTQLVQDLMRHLVAYENYAATLT